MPEKSLENFELASAGTPSQASRNKTIKRCSLEFLALVQHLDKNIFARSMAMLLRVVGAGRMSQDEKRVCSIARARARLR